MKYITIFLLLTCQILTGQTLSVSGCCNNHLEGIKIDWNVSGARNLALIGHRYERLIPIMTSGSYQAYAVDRIEIRGASNNVLISKDIEPCCPIAYQIVGDFIYFKEAGEYTINKMMGFGKDIWWKQVFKKAVLKDAHQWLGKGMFVVVFTHPNKSFRPAEIIQIN